MTLMMVLLLCTIPGTLNNCKKNTLRQKQQQKKACACIDADSLTQQATSYLVLLLHH